ncbi:MAG: PAS domain S-box protein [Rhodospirillaceae bacterium]
MTGTGSGSLGIVTVALNGAAGLVIWLAAYASQGLFQGPQAMISIVSMVIGISVSLGITFGPRAFGGVAVGLVLALLTPASLPLSAAAILTGAGALATFTAGLLIRARHDITFPDRPEEAIRQALVGIILPAAIAASAALALGESLHLSPVVLVKSLLVKTIAVILMTLPVLLAFLRPLPPRQHTHDGEGLVIGLLLLFLLTIGFGIAVKQTTNMRYLPVGLIMPTLVWVGIRLPSGAAAMAVALVGITATIGTAMGGGPFALGAGDDAFKAALFVCTAAVVALGTASLSAETEALRRALRPVEAAAGEQMRKAREFLDAAPMAAVLASLDGAVRYANQRQAELMQSAATDLTGADTWRFFADPKDRHAMLATLDKNGRVDAFEYRLKRSDGSVVWVEESWVPVQIDGQSCILSWSTDISGRKQAEEALRSSERRLRAILDDSPVAVSISRPGGRIIYANPKAAAMMSLPRALLIGCDGRDFYADAAQREHIHDVMRSGGAVINEEVELKSADGRHRSVVFTLLPMEYDGAPANLAWSFDITARKHAEQQLRTSEGRLRAILEATPLAMGVLYLGGRLGYANAALLKQFGLKQEDTHSLRPGTLFEDRELVAQLAAEVATGAAPRNVEARMRRTDGTTFWALLSFAQGEFEGRPAVFAWAADITDRMEAAAALARHRDDLEQAVEESTRELAVLNKHLERELEDRNKAEADVRRGQTYLRAVLDTVADGIITVNSRGLMEEFNPAAERIFGYSRQEAIGQNIAMLMPQPEAERHDEHLERYLIEGNPRVIGRRREFFGRRKNGDLFPLYLVVTETAVEGRPLYTGLLRDITEQREAEEALLAAKEEAEFANRTKSEFLANMSHELRTPLNAIIGFSEMMQSGILGRVEPAAYRGYVDNIHDSGRHLLDVINDILDISRIEAGRLNLYEEDFNLAEVIDDCLKLIQPRTDVAELKLRRAVPPTLPALHGDERRIKQIALNLLANAVKFTPVGGTVTIGAALVDDPASDWGLELSVSDTGIGMSKEDCAKVLAPFVQVDTGLSRRYEGTGLGLPLVVALAELHGAKLGLDSEPGMGTTATVRFPRKRLVPTAPEPAVAEAP